MTEDGIGAQQQAAAYSIGLGQQQDQPQNRPPPFRIIGDRAALFKAFAQARAEFIPLDTNQTAEVQMKQGGQYTFDYADLASLQAATVPALSKYGLSIFQPWWQEDKGFVSLTILAHESGASMETEVFFIEDGNKQALGSALTYIQRYQWRSVCGISASKDDDDGNKSVGNKAIVTPRQSKPQQQFTPDPLMKEIAEKVRALRLSKSEGEALMKEAIKTVKHSDLLTAEEAAKFIVALTNEQARRDAKEKIK